MTTSYEVDLLFRAPKSPALDQLNRQLAELDRKAGSLGGNDPFKGVTGGARTATGAVGGLKGALIGLAATLGPLVSVAAAVGSIQAVFTAGAEIESQTRSLKVLTGSLGQAKDIIKELQTYGAVTPFTSSELVETAKRLKAFGVETQDVVTTTKRLGDVAGATGSNLGELATAYGQVQAKGRLQGEELLQFQERGVAVGEELRKMYGDKFPAALEKGQISAKAVEVALERLTAKGGQYFGGAIAQADTLNGKLSTLQDSFGRLAANIGTALAPVFKFVIDGLNSIIERINDITFGGGKGLTRDIQARKQATEEADQKFGGSITKLPMNRRQEYGDFVRKRQEEIYAQKMKELEKPASTGPVKPPSATPALLAGTGAAKDPLKLEKDLLGVRLDAIKALAEKEADAARDVAELNKGLIKDLEQARRQSLERLAELQKGFAEQELQLRRKGEDSSADLKLQRDIGNLRGSPEEKAAMQGLLEFEASYKQKQRDQDRALEDNKRTRALNLEKFKADNAKTIGDINAKYTESYGKIQENYALNTAKILMTAAENMGKIWEASAANLQAAATGGATAGGGGGATAPVGGGAVGIARALMDRLNLTPAQASGVVGNFQRESKLNPRINEGGAVGLPARKGGYGIAQWTGSRQEDLIRFAGGAQQAGELPRQIDFLIRELRTSESGALAALRQAKTPEQAAKVFEETFERAGVKALGDRIGYARDVFKQLQAGGGATAGKAVGGAGAPFALTGSTGIGSGAHLDVRWADGRPITQADANKFISAGGKSLGGREYPMTSGYGPRRAPVAGASTFHKGIDFGTPTGTPLALKGGATFAGSMAASESGGGGIVGIIDTPMGRMKVLHLDKILAKGGAATGGSGGAVTLPTQADLKPLPARLGPQKGYDATADLAGLKARGDLLISQEQKLNDIDNSEARQRYLNERSAAIRDINTGMAEQLRLGYEDAAMGEKRLSYLRDGINPALADGFVEIDKQAGANRRLLDAQVSSLQAELARSDLTPALVPVYQELLTLAQGELAALDGMTAQRRNQLALAERQKKNPGRILTEELAGRQDKLDSLLNPANQIISAADSIGSAFSNAFEGIASGSMTAGEALESMLKNIGSSFLKMASDIMSQQLVMGLIRMLGGGLMGGGSAPLLGGMGGGLNSFAGGGFTGSASRSGGVDGKGGFPAILHPNETVIDHAGGRRAMEQARNSINRGPGAVSVTNSGPTLVFEGAQYTRTADVPAIIRQAVTMAEARIVRKQRNHPGYLGGRN